MADVKFFRVIQVGTCHGSFIDRRRKVIGDCIQKQLYSFIFIGGAAKDRSDQDLQGSLPNCMFQQGDRNFFFIKVKLHDLFIEFSHFLDDLCSCHFHLFKIFLRNGYFNPFEFFEFIGFPLNDIDDAGKVFFFPDLNLEWKGVGIKVFVHLVNHIRQIRSYPVHLVDKSNPGDPVAVSLVPDGLTLRLDPTNGTKYGYHPIDDPE